MLYPLDRGGQYFIIVSEIFILPKYSVSCTLLYLNIFHSKDGQDDRISAADPNQSSAPLSYNVSGVCDVFTAAQRR